MATQADLKLKQMACMVGKLHAHVSFCIEYCSVCVFAVPVCIAIACTVSIPPKRKSGYADYCEVKIIINQSIINHQQTKINTEFGDCSIRDIYKQYTPFFP